MPKRLLDDSLLSSPSVAACSPRAQDAFPRLILVADDFGCLDANQRVLVGRGWPHRDDVSTEELERWLEEWSRAGMVFVWEESGRRFAYLTGWHGEHGQKWRDEYDRDVATHGSKRKTPRPPGWTGAKPVPWTAPPEWIPGTVFRPGKSNNSLPARETAGPDAGNGREKRGSRRVPAAFPGSAVVVPAAVPSLRSEVAPSPGDSPPSSPVVASLPCVGEGPKEYGVTAAQVAGWSEAYPGVDVAGEVRKAHAWLEANPKRRKTHRGCPAFLVRWLGRAQNGGRLPPAGRAAANPSELPVLDAKWLGSLTPEARDEVQAEFTKAREWVLGPAVWESDRARLLTEKRDQIMERYTP